MIELIASEHPLIVHFAVALTISSVFFDVLDFLFHKKEFETTGFMLITFSIPFLLSAVLSGNLAYQFLNDPNSRVIADQHQTYANIGMWLFSGAFIWRVFMILKKQYAGMKKIIYLFVVAAAAISIFLAAQKGATIFHHKTAAKIHAE